MSAAASEWRVGQRTGQKLWQVKRAPGWRVVHQCDSLHAAAEYLVGHGVALASVVVVTAHPWRPLSDFCASNV